MPLPEECLYSMPTHGAMVNVESRQIHIGITGTIDKCGYLSGGEPLLDSFWAANKDPAGHGVVFNERGEAALQPRSAQAQPRMNSHLVSGRMKPAFEVPGGQGRIIHIRVKNPDDSWSACLGGLFATQYDPSSLPLNCAQQSFSLEDVQRRAHCWPTDPKVLAEFPLRWQTPNPFSGMDPSHQRTHSLRNQG